MLLKWDEVLNAKLGFTSEITYASILSLITEADTLDQHIYKKFKKGEIGLIITQGWARA